jgi:sigma-B regulation protein RsbU (phosphoserine phosphatase)
VRTTMPRVLDPGRCLEEVNRQLCYQVFNGQFVTMLILVIDVERGEVEVATAGHPPPLVGDGESFQPLPVDPQLVLGIERDVRYPTARLPLLTPRSSIVLYTDGVLDAQAPSGERFDVDGLKRCLYGRFDSAQLMLDVVLAAVNEFRGARDLSDDVTLVTIQMLGAAASPAAPAEELEAVV